MRQLIIDLNTKGIVEDLQAIENKDTEKLLLEINRTNNKPELIADEGDSITISLDRNEFKLKVTRALGGNQWNVSENLRFLRPEAVNNTTIKTHFGLPEGVIARKNLYIPGLKNKIDLTDTDEVGDLVFDRDLNDTDLFISSSPHGESGKTYWAGLREALRKYPNMGIFWNPGIKQITKNGLEPETVEALKNRVKIMQVNEAEAVEMVKNHIDEDGNSDRLHELVNPKWTVVTRGPEGIRAYADGIIYNQEVLSATSIAKKLLGIDYCEGNDVGCGDAVMATLIANFETASFQTAIFISTVIAKYQFHHKGPNLMSSTVLHKIAREQLRQA